MYVAVSRAKHKLSLYTADKAKLFKQAERSTAKENPSDYLTLFNLVNPDAENQKTAEPPETYEVQINPNTLAIALESALRTATAPLYEEIGQLTAGSERAESRAASLTPEYVSDVRGVVAGIAERRRTAELERQAERIGEAAQGLIDGARQLEQTATAVARLDRQLEQKAEATE